MSTRTTSPALTATQIIPARVTSVAQVGQVPIFVEGAWAWTALCLPDASRSAEPVDGLGTGLTATFLTPQTGAARPYRTDTPRDYSSPKFASSVRRGPPMIA